MKTFLEFIEKHKKFVKKIILFAIYIIVVCVINSEPVTEFFIKLFGDIITSAISISSMFLLIGGVE